MPRDRPVLIPVGREAIGGVVTEPDGAPAGAAVLLEGIGGRRAGLNGVWTRLARALADAGLETFRFDHPGVGESIALRTRGPDGRPARTAIAWFRARTADLPLVAIGVCLGGRLAVEVINGDPNAVGLALVSPYLRTRRAFGSVVPARVGRHVWRRPSARPVDRVVVRAIADAASAGTWVLGLVGEQDRWRGDVLEAGDRIRAGPAAGRFELREVPGVRLHDRSLDAEVAIRDGLVSWIRSLRLAGAER